MGLPLSRYPDETIRLCRYENDRNGIYDFKDYEHTPIAATLSRASFSNFAVSYHIDKAGIPF